MSTPRPRRPSPAVYRRRRIVVFTALIVVLALIIWGVWALIAGIARGAEAPASSPSASAPSASGSAVSDAPTDAAAPPASEAASPAPSAAGTGECSAANVTVTAVTDQTTYAADQNPQLSISLTNTSNADCTMNVGTSAQSFIITSGADTWWRSTDCQSAPSDQVVTIAAGQTVKSATPITWDRTRSSVDTCQDANRAKAPGGGASYHLAVSIGGIPGTGTAQFILN